MRRTDRGTGPSTRRRGDEVASGTPQNAHGNEWSPTFAALDVSKPNYVRLVDDRSMSPTPDRTKSPTPDRLGSASKAIVGGPCTWCWSG